MNILYYENPYSNTSTKSKAVPLHAMKALRGEEI
jgi:hypothetical protein